MHVLAPNQVVEKYPYSIGNLRKDNPKVSFPKVPDDPHLSLNTTAAEVTTDDSIDPDSSGFIVNQVATTNINVSSASYIYLAIS